LYIDTLIVVKHSKKRKVKLIAMLALAYSTFNGHRQSFVASTKKNRVEDCSAQARI